MDLRTPAHLAEGACFTAQITYTPPTYTSDGYQTYWQCSICDQCFFDEDGTHLIADERDMASLIVPRLTDPDNSSLQTSISTGLTSVPETVAQQYPTVDAIYQALVQAAQASNTSLKGIRTKAGILVRFTSMSPVCITYQIHTSTGADRTAAVGVSSPRTADSRRVALWSAACVCSAALLLSITVKKKKYA